MAKVAPTILATTAEDYGVRIERVEAFAKRLHIDISDGIFSDTKTVGLAQVYGIEGVPFDLHLMVSHPEAQVENVIALKPSLVIAHFEAEGNLEGFFDELRECGLRLGLAIMPETAVAEVATLLPKVDHLLVFTGTLGHNGGDFKADCLDKIGQARAINADLEIAVDGGIDEETGRRAVEAGADVLDSGSFIHEATDPEQAYKRLEAII